MEYGFVYIWRDRKHKRYYIGCHWGTENDGYICSSSWMNSSYKKRPQDFKRRILIRIYSSRKNLLEEENYWLKMIKKEEMSPLTKKPKYYNLHNHEFGHWSTDEKTLLTLSEKQSERQKNNPDWGKWNEGVVRDKENRKKISIKTKEAMARPEVREKYLKSLEKRPVRSGNPEVRAKTSASMKLYYETHTRSEETRKKISENSKRLHAEGKIGRRKETNTK